MKVKTNRARGKAHQKRTAEVLDGINLGTLGKVDVITEKFSIECKSRENSAVFTWFKQAEKYSNGKIPLLVIHKKNTHYENDLVVMKLSDFRKEVCNG